jgi:hypothetical protein
MMGFFNLILTSPCEEEGDDQNEIPSALRERLIFLGIL